MSPARLASCAVILAAFAQPAAAVTFNFTQKSGDTLSSEQAAAFRTAAAVWSAALTDAIVVNVQIGFAALGGNVLGATAPTVVTAARQVVGEALGADATSAADAQAVRTFASGTAAQVAMTSAEARALGFSVQNLANDGSIEFSNSYNFSTMRDADGTIAPGTFDLIGIAEHEIGHILGFVSGIDYGSSVQFLLDQFRYGSSNTRSFASGASAYFSYDGGVTDVANFATGTNNQASHWAIGTSGVMVPEVGAGQVQNITALDVLAMDVIGYNVVPEPWSLSLLAFGTIAAARVRRRS